jgi:hypothetical protein
MPYFKFYRITTSAHEAMARGKTVEIYLVDGTTERPESTEILRNNKDLATFIPRQNMKDVVSRVELSYPGIYFIFGNSEDSEKPCVYIGKSQDCLDQIEKHDETKDFWNCAIVITASDKTHFTSTHIDYLEEKAISRASEASRFLLENTNNPRGNPISESMKDQLEDILDNIIILVGALGYPLFESLGKKSTESKDILFCNGAEGEYREDGFSVFKGSKANKNLAAGSEFNRKNPQEKLLTQNILVDRGTHYELQEDYSFKSPSAAAAQVLGRNANGWIEWKDKTGKNLDDLIRKSTLALGVFKTV